MSGQSRRLLACLSSDVITALGGVIRRATSADGRRLHDIRHAAISTLAPTGMPEEMAQRWAQSWSIGTVEQILTDRDVWVFECDGGVLGWVSFTGSEIDGLYTDPLFVRRGIGSCLLTFAESQIASRGASEACVEASRNAEDFYLRRGWEPTGPRPADGARPMAKRLQSN
jgi:GNAT superfamily N-acetyltransferase